MIPEAVTESPPTEQTRVLVAEDMPEMRRLMELELQTEGYAVDVVSTGTALWRRCMADAADEIDLIVTDVRMPGIDGIEVLRRLRARGIETPVLVVTGFGDAQLHREAQALGARVLDKPFDFDTLLHLVDTIIAQRRID